MSDADREAVLLEADEAKTAGLLFPPNDAEEEAVEADENEVLEADEEEVVEADEAEVVDDPPWEDCEAEEVEPVGASSEVPVVEPAAASSSAPSGLGFPLTRFLALRLAYGTASSADLRKAAGL